VASDLKKIYVIVSVQKSTETILLHYNKKTIPGKITKIVVGDN
jgi:hypothetical protein